MARELTQEEYFERMNDESLGYKCWMGERDGSGGCLVDAGGRYWLLEPGEAVSSEMSSLMDWDAEEYCASHGE